MEKYLPDNWEELDKDDLLEASYEAINAIAIEDIEKFEREYGVTESELLSAYPLSEEEQYGISRSDADTWRHDAFIAVEAEREKRKADEIVAERVSKVTQSFYDAAQREGWDIEEPYHSRSSNSTYTKINFDPDYGSVLEVRFSDHDQVEGGGFNPETRSRSGESDISVNVVGGKVDVAVILEKARSLMSAMSESKKPRRKNDRFSITVKQRLNVHVAEKERESHEPA